jgi:hypothetical protein
LKKLAFICGDQKKPLKNKAIFFPKSLKNPENLDLTGFVFDLEKKSETLIHKKVEMSSKGDYSHILILD